MSSDSIVRVRAIAAARGPRSLRKGSTARRFQGPVPMVEFEPIEVLKGDVPTLPLRLVGIVVPNDDYNDHAVPYDFVRAAGRRGMCFATEYRLGAEYLLLLRNGKAYWSPLAPTNEQVRGPDDAWVIWVRGSIDRRK